MQGTRQFGRRLGDHVADHRPHDRIIDLSLYLGRAGHSGEGPLVEKPVVQRTDVVERALREAHGEMLAAVLFGHVIDRHLVEAGRQRLDRLKSGSDLGMLALRDLRRDEDAQMPHLVMDHVDDPLAADPDLGNVGIGLDDPVQCLLRRRNVVAMTGETMIGARIAFRSMGRPARASPHSYKAVADEKLLNNHGSQAR